MEQNGEAGIISFTSSQRCRMAPFASRAGMDFTGKNLLSQEEQMLSYKYSQLYIDYLSHSSPLPLAPEILSVYTPIFRHCH